MDKKCNADDISEADMASGAFEVLREELRAANVPRNLSLTCFVGKYMFTVKSLDAESKLQKLIEAAGKGDAASQFNLGMCIADGVCGTADKKESVLWFKKSAERGYVPAQYNLAMCYRYGIGVDVNLAVAVKWMQRAAE